MKKLKTLLYLSFIFIPFGLHAQLDCALKLREAQEVYNAGQIEKVPGLLEDCLHTGFTREEKLTAYKLLINSSLFDDNFGMADVYMMEFLKKFPDYQSSAADPDLFISLMNEFDNRPRYNIGVAAGLNSSNVRLIENYGIHNLNEVEGEYLPSGFGFQAGIAVSKMFGEKMEAGFEPAYMQLKYEYNLLPFSFASVSYKETQNILLLPLTFSYKFPLNIVDTYLKTGFTTRVLLTAKSNTNRDYLETGSVPLNDIKSPETIIKDKRVPVNYAAGFGGGVRYNIPTGYFFLEASYNLSLLNDVEISSRKPANDEQSLVYYQVDNDFSINYFTLSVGFSYSFYKPKKL